MNAFLPPWLIAAALALAWGAVGFYGGYQYCDNAWQAHQAQQLRAQAQAMQAEQARSQSAARQSSLEQQALQQSYTVLKGKFDAFNRRGPLVVWRAGACGATAGAVDGGTGNSGTGADSPREIAPRTGAGAAADAIGLSAGAIWLWNSALTATDTPAGACGAADTASEACALDAEVSIEAAWANHAANAQSCAADRLRHQRLIDYIEAAQGTP